MALRELRDYSDDCVPSPWIGESFVGGDGVSFDGAERPVRQRDGAPQERSPKIDRYETHVTSVEARRM